MAQTVKNLPAMPSPVGKINWRREWLPTLVFLPGEFHGQRSLAGYSSWGHKESDMTEQLSLTHNKKWKFLSVAGHLQKGELSEIVDWISIGIHRLRVIFWTFLFLFPWGM